MSAISFSWGIEMHMGCWPAIRREALGAHSSGVAAALQHLKRMTFCHWEWCGRMLTGMETAPGNVAVMLPGAAVPCCEAAGVVTEPTAPGKLGGCLPETGTAGFMPASALAAAGAGEGELAGFIPLVPVLPPAWTWQQHGQLAMQNLTASTDGKRKRRKASPPNLICLDI